jgi:hypothetical protein
LHDGIRMNGAGLCITAMMQSILMVFFQSQELKEQQASKRKKRGARSREDDDADRDDDQVQADMPKTKRNKKR